MPSTRRVVVRENWRKRARPSPVLESEPQDLRVVTGRVVMDQNVETNGCDDGPISLAVSNHNDVAPVSFILKFLSCDDVLCVISDNFSSDH
ncbi:hypothetical protein AVEN_132078-1 [Araneus ventricosus]|uniref:Uncharacterized protein n=1 Tax=Araneus ventricosus TaxID=182803 RepID=A0A4Y2F9F3_ARAVE|nr:hypothetical protein AVEN_132078-1 [Araneus ventricosus]